MTKSEYDKVYYRQHKQKRAEQSKIQYENNKELRAAQAKAARQVKKAFCQRFKLAAACFDCGYNSQVEALEFDHINGAKHKGIGSMHGQGWPQFLKEVGKCVVRCANCHAIKTHKEHYNENTHPKLQHIRRPDRQAYRLREQARLLREHEASGTSDSRSKSA